MKPGIIAPGESETAAVSRRRWAWIAGLSAPALIAPVCWFLYEKTSVHAATLCGGTLVVLLVTAAATDICVHRIFNWTTYPAFLWAVGINTYASIRYPEQIGAAVGMPDGGSSATADSCSDFLRLGAVGIANCLLGAAACFVLMLIIYSLSGRGAGDVKIATAIGALLGFRLGLAALCLTYLLAGMTVLSWVVWKEGPLYVLKKTLGWLFGWLHPRMAMWAVGESGDPNVLKRPIPLGLFYALGTATVLFDLIPVT